MNRSFIFSLALCLFAILCGTHQVLAQTTVFSGRLTDLKDKPRKGRTVNIEVIEKTKDADKPHPTRKLKPRTDGKYEVTVKNADTTAVTIIFTGPRLAVTRLENVLVTNKNKEIDVAIPDEEKPKKRIIRIIHYYPPSCVPHYVYPSCGPVIYHR